LTLNKQVNLRLNLNTEKLRLKPKLVMLVGVLKLRHLLITTALLLIRKFHLSTLLKQESQKRVILKMSIYPLLI